MLLHSKLVTSLPARALLVASVAAFTLTSFGAQAGPITAQASAPQQASPSTNSEFGARKRYRRGNAAAGLAMMGLMVGTVGAVIAAQQRREAYERAYAAPRYYSYGGGYPHAYGHSHVYSHSPRYHYRNPAAINSWNSPYDDPVIRRLNAQTPGVINYGPPRVGF